MSVHQESLSHVGMAEDHASESEHVAVRHESLALFGAAIAGAILGTLLTLLVLAFLNDGTLLFTGSSSRLGRWEEAFNQLSTNVSTNSGNIETMNANMQQTTGILNEKLAAQDLNIEGIHSAVDDLNVTRGQFDTLVTAISGAIDSIKGNETAAEPEAANSEAAADAEATDSADAEAAAIEVTTGSLSVLFFADTNGNKELDAGEESLLGISAALVNGDGESVATLESTDGGMLFEALAAGEYTLVVTDAGEYALETDTLGVVTVPEDGGEQVVYVAVEME